MEKLLDRGVAQVLPNKEGLEALIQKRKIRIYLGVDPTSPNLHLGHAVALRKLRQFQDLGHEVVLLFGTFTARIGDPSGRDKMRQPLGPKEIAANMATYKKQAGLILNNSKTVYKENGAWLGKLKLDETLKIASRLTVSRLLERDMFQERIKEGREIWLHEFLYPLLQGYDSVAMDVDAELGGTDQTFNMLVGRRLLESMKKKEKFVVMVPILPGLDGRKMSKSYGNTVNLLDVPEDMYGKLMSLNDNLIPQYFKLCTDVSPTAVAPRDLKAQLAREIVRMYHGEKKAKEAEEEFERVFRKKEMPSEIPEFHIDLPKDIVSILIETKIASSKSQAWRLVGQKGVQYKKPGASEWETVSNPQKNILEGGIIRVGRRFARIA
ncbi:MAG: tyrosine--tRNA ligase [Parcubacteria group bacterium]|nr:tyrosine--tRNA ligase [Parcubacteria group bacterium]